MTKPRNVSDRFYEVLAAALSLGWSIAIYEFGWRYDVAAVALVGLATLWWLRRHRHDG